MTLTYLPAENNYMVMLRVKYYLKEKRFEMYEVKNRSGWDINIDGVTIPSYNTALFNSFSDRLYVNSLLNKQEISI